MPTYEEEKQENMAAYARLKNEISTKYKGQYVAIAEGRPVKVSPVFEEADQAVRNHLQSLVFPAGEEPEIGPLRVRLSRV